MTNDMDDNDRRQNCLLHQKTTTDIERTVFGNGRPGLKEDMITVKTRLNIMAWLQTITMLAMVSGAIKLIFFGG